MKNTYTQLNINESAMICFGLGQELTLRAIARSVNRHHTTISRELIRNNVSVQMDKLDSTLSNIDYCPPIAQQRLTHYLASLEFPESFLLTLILKIKKTANSRS